MGKPRVWVTKVRIPGSAPSIALHSDGDRPRRGASDLDTKCEDFPRGRPHRSDPDTGAIARPFPMWDRARTPDPGFATCVV